MYIFQKKKKITRNEICEEKIFFTISFIKERKYKRYEVKSLNVH